MVSSSRLFAFIVPFLILSSLFLLFLFKDVLFPTQNRPAEPNQDDFDEISNLIDNSFLIPIIIDGKNTTAVLSAKYLMYQDAVNFCVEKNLTLPEKPFQVQSLQDVKGGKLNFFRLLIQILYLFEIL